MKLFIQDHFLLIVIQFIQLGLIVFIFWMDGYRNVTLIGYAIFLSLFFFISYLFYRYLSRRHFYQRLSNPLHRLDASLVRTESAPISKSLDQLLIGQYRLYQTEIEKAREQQEEQMLFMDRWIHQMKTPISVIDLTTQELDEPEATSIREETERMKHGLNTVLYMARFRSIVEDFQIKPVKLAEVLHEVNQKNKRFYIQNQVYPKLQESRPGITVATDEKWLFFIVTQLIHNGVKYSAGKSNQLKQLIYERGGKVVLEIQDFGIGIPKVDQKRAFQKFYTGENGRKYRESTGIGLYLVKGVIEKLEHEIELESNVGEGTTLRIIFSPSQNLTTM